MKSVAVRWLVFSLLLFNGLVAPTLVHASINVALAWDPSADPDVAGYNLYYGEVGGTSTNQVLIGMNTSGTIPGLTAGKSYFSYVTATSNSGGESAPSNYVNYQPSTTVQSSGPQITAVADQSVASGNLLTVTLSAVEPGATAPVFSYSLVSGPSGVAVDSASGVLTWTPTASQAPSTNVLTVQVMDNGNPPLSGSASFKVVVTKSNSAPILKTVGTQSFSETVAGDLVSNGSFEAGYTGWTMSGNQRVDNGYATDGTNSVRFNSGDLAPNGILSQSLSTVPGQQYVLSFDLGAFSLVNQNEQRLAVTLQGIGTLLSRTFSQTAPGTGTKWAPQSVTFTADASSTVLTFQDVSLTTASVDLWLDNVHVMGSGSGAVLTASVGQALSAPITASDVDAPPQVLTYSLVSGPIGAALDPATGTFTWTPTLAQANQTYVITVKVADNGTPSLSDTESFKVYVPAVNTPPVLTPVPNLIATVGSLVTWPLSATDTDTPVQSLSFSLVAGPTGATVDVSSGLFSWTPVAAQAGVTATVTVRVTDSGVPALSDTKSFAIIVTAPNTPPVLAPVADQTIPEGSTFVLNLPASDQDLPVQSLTYKLVSGPAGATLDPLRGTFTWTPTEAQGPNTYQVTVQVTDNGTPALSDSKTFNIAVQEVNRAPVLSPLADQTVSAGQILMLSLTAVDPDIPANNLTYRLVSGPSGMKVDPITGVLTWRLSKSQAISTNVIIVAVSDDGVPSLTSTTSFSVIVSGKRAGTAQSPYKVTNLETVSWVAEVAPGQQVRFTHSFPPAKQTGQSVHYLEVSEDLINWVTLGAISDVSELRDSDAMGTQKRFYRIRTEDNSGTSVTQSADVSAN